MGYLHQANQFEKWFFDMPGIWLDPTDPQAKVYDSVNRSGQTLQDVEENWGQWIDLDRSNGSAKSMTIGYIWPCPTDLQEKVYL